MQGAIEYILETGIKCPFFVGKTDNLSPFLVYIIEYIFPSDNIPYFPDLKVIAVKREIAGMKRGVMTVLFHSPRGKSIYTTIWKFCYWKRHNY